MGTIAKHLLKDLPLKLQDSSVKSRTELLSAIANSLSTKQDGSSEESVPADLAAKSLAKVLPLVLPRYSDTKSRKSVLDLVAVLIDKHFESTFKVFASSLHEAFASWANIVPTLYTVKIAIFGFQWTSLVVSQAIAKGEFTGAEAKKILEVQAILVANIQGVANLPKRIKNKFQGLLNKQFSDEKALTQCLAIYKLLNPSYHSLVYGSVLLSRKEEIKASLLESLVKLVITNKQKTPSHVLQSLQDLFRSINHEDFKGQLLPPMSKAMLRNPELVMETFSLILALLSIDLSQYVQDLAKPFATQLHANDDSTRDSAIKCVASLASKCSDTDTMVSLLKSIFDVLNGSEGKLSVASHKLSLLSAISSLSDNALLANGKTTLCVKMTESMIKILETEIHEGTLLQALDCLQIWFVKSSCREVPSAFMQWIPKALTLKSSTSSIKSAYFQCLFEALLQASTIPKSNEIQKAITKSLDNATRQTAQVAIVSEAAHCCACFMKLNEDEVENANNEVMKVLLDQKLAMFTSEKFLTSASGSALKSACLIAEKIILHHPGNSLDKWSKVIAMSLVHNENSTRAYAALITKRLGNKLGGLETLKQIGNQLRQYLWLNLANDLENDNLKIGNIKQAIVNLCKAVTSDGTLQMALIILPICHHPSVLEADRDLWLRCCKRMSVNPSDLIKCKSEEIIQNSLEDFSKSGYFVMETCSKINPDEIVPRIVELSVQAIEKADLKVTMLDYAVFLTPEGQVYDRTTIDNLKESNESKNIKRENKAYSYKEQMEEIALRKEIEEKKKREGKWQEPKLTPKQKEAMAAQLEKEGAVRSRLMQTKNALEPILTILSSSIRGQPKAFASVISNGRVLPLLFKAAQCPLFSKLMDDLFKNLKLSVYENEDEILAQSIVASTLTILRDESGNKRSLLKSMLEQIYQSTCGDPSSSCPFTTPGFHLAFKLIREAIWALKDDNDMLSKGLAIINEHSILEGSSIDEVGLIEIDELHPKYLPRKEMMSLLIDILIFCSSPTAVTALISVCKSGSDGIGLAKAQNDELEILFNALKHENQCVRDATLRGLDALDEAVPDESSDLFSTFVQRLFVARNDPVPENQILADQLWKKHELEPYPLMHEDIIEDVVYPVSASLRTAASISLAKCPDLDPTFTLEKILDLYDDKLETTPPVLDGLGRVIQDSIDHWEPRQGLALALQSIASSLQAPDLISKATNFLVKDGLIDRNEAVRKKMLSAAMAIVDLHGKVTAADLLPVFEEFLDNAPKEEKYDNARQSVVILMGSLAKHLDPSDPKVRPIMRQLILALNTPSQQVQEAVANCLPPLVPTIKEEAPEIVNNLIATLLGGADISFGERRGAAYGLAGFVKGLGILSLKQLDIMGKLTTAVTDKKQPKAREGALFAFEMLCSMLGRLFEPYIVHILPHLLLCFGDPVDHVREAADDCAKAVMSKLSAHGVKLVLPALLNALEEDQWRTKTGSVELLGAMAYCAPKQLSSCLPSIVPKLIEVLSDSHHKVQKAGAQALKQIGNVIRNPEIQAIVPILLKALQDPSAKTGECLQTLLDTKFVHFIDAPSLALIMPVVQRAFKDRSTETRKMAAQIIGNMYSLTDQKDLSPYLPGILPGLKSSLLDPVPEVRTVSARALGAMVKGMGESSFEELLPWLMTTLTSESSGVDRSGAAQGLAEVVGGLGVSKMHELMPDIIRTSERSDIAPHVKDGYIMMFIFMPSVFPEEFTQYIGQIINPILRALADENEFVRDTAYKAGQRIVLTYADTAVLLLLPELEKGLFNDNWRIRYSSVQLLGDLLYKISGVSGKMTTETAGEDDNFGTESSQKAVITVLGPERYHRVLAGLYMGRSDVALMVRQAALHVWKVVVSNTPKTLRELLPTLFNLLLGCLASNSYDKRQVAARTLGDLVKKLGERVLPEIIPILEKGLKSDMPEKRQGVCVGLSEIMSSTSRDMVLSFVDSLVPTVRRALCDESPDVRAAAAKTFDSLHNTVGSRALDDILPPMLEEMTINSSKDDEDSKIIYENTLDGLKQVMAIKARAVLPYLVPQLIAPPVNTRALASLAPVSGEALHRHLPKILPALISALAEAENSRQDEQEFAEAVVLSVSDDDSDHGVSCIMEELLSASNFKRDEHNRPKVDEVTLSKQRAAVSLLACFCKDTKCDYSQYVPQLIRTLILLFTSKDQVVLNQAWNALNSVTKTLDTADQMAHVGDVRQAVRFAVADLRYHLDAPDLMPGFCLPKGITPILPIFRESILNGSPDLKEAAANGLGEVIKLTSSEALKPSVVHITGPLIRILGDRFGANVKTAVLDTLAGLLSKAGVLLKPFFPQLQTTFVKALNDPNRTVRLKAGMALSFLIDIHMRPDPLFNELANGIKNADEASVRDTYLQAMRGCLEPSGSKMSAPIRRQVLPLLLSLVTQPEDTSRSAAAGCLGAFCKWLPEDDLTNVIEDVLLNSSGSDVDWQIKHGRSAALYVALKDAPERLCESYEEKVINTIKSLLSSDVVALAQNGVRATGYFFLYLMKNKMELINDLITPFCRAMNHQSNDVKQMVAVISNFWGKSLGEALLPPELLKSLLPMLVNGTKEKNSTVRSFSETALVCVLHLRNKEDKKKSAECLQVLPSGSRDALQDVINKVLQRVANQPEGKEEVIDDTLVNI